MQSTASWLHLQKTYETLLSKHISMQYSHAQQEATRRVHTHGKAKQSHVKSDRMSFSYSPTRLKERELRVRNKSEYYNIFHNKVYILHVPREKGSKCLTS